MNYIFLVLLILCCSYAAVFGGGPERIGAAIYALGSVLTYFVVTSSVWPYTSVETGILILDAITFIAFVVLALKADRHWTMWVAALLGVGLVGHLGKYFSKDVIPWAYAVVLTIWSYPILLLLAVGTWNHRKRMTANKVS